MPQLSGLTTQDVTAKRTQFGRNEITATKKFSALSLFFSQFPSFINAILLFAAIFSILIHEPIDSIFIIAIIFLNGLLGFIQEFRAEKSLEKLKNFATPLTRVIRDSQEQQLPTAELVPGDIVVLGEGDRIPADGKLVESHHTEIDEAILTGESVPVTKEDNEEVFMGTLIIKGKGVMEVSAIGMQTRFGQIAATLSTIEDEKTPLQKNLSTLGKTLSIAALFVSLLLIPIGIFQGRELAPLLLLTISIGIAAIPEGLPAVVTIALALGTSRMAKRNAIVRKMAAVETLGSMQVVIVDKTGTLTQNSMRVKTSWMKDPEKLSDMLFASMLGNTASITSKNNAVEILGDRTDGALLLWSREQKADIDEILKSGKILDEHVFDTKTKTITTVWEKDGLQFAYVRGAPESILQRSTLSEEEKQTALEQVAILAKDGLRVIGFGSKKTTTADATNREALEKDLTFSGIVGIYDPPRTEVRQAMIDAHTAGINVIMVTGDNELTALAIAKEVRLVASDEPVITGDKLEQMSDEQVTEALATTHIFARSKPHDKMRLVTLLEKQGLVVGVTGDGVNDALALKKADVGVAMGITGTDVAKEASEVVLADDNFSTLVQAVREGRNIYQNIATAIMYLLSGNLTELSIVFLATLFNQPAPLLATQILWINLVTDALPALALASDTKSRDLMHQPPRNPKEHILTRKRFGLIAAIGFGVTILLVGLFEYLLSIHEETLARTVIFNCLVFYQLGLAFFIRRQSPFKATKLLWLTVLFTAVLQILVNTVPFFQNIFS